MSLSGLSPLKRKQLAGQNGSNIRYTHFCYNEGHVTVASILDREEQVFYYGVAFCAPEDQFSRKTGRLIAIKKLFSDAEKTLFTGAYNALSASKTHEMAADIISVVVAMARNTCWVERWWMRPGNVHNKLTVCARKRNKNKKENLVFPGFTF